MSLTPIGCLINDVPYRISSRADSYREYVQPRIAQSGEIAGASRPSRNARPDVLTWRWDDWSLGEGQKSVNPRDDDSWRRYWYNSTGAIDVTTPGQISLGFKLSQSYASGATTYTTGPYLALTKYAATNNTNNVGVLVDSDLLTMGAVDTWTDRGSVANDAGNMVNGVARSAGGVILAPYWDGSGAASSRRLRRITWDGTTLTSANQYTVATVDNCVVISDNRIFDLQIDGSATVLLSSSDYDQVGVAPTNLYTAKGAGFASAMDARGNQLYMVVHNSGEDPFLHIWDGAKGYHRLTAPVGFRMRAGAGTAAAPQPPCDAARFLGDVFYLAGWYEKDVKRAALAYVTPGATRTLGLIRDDIEESIAQVLLPTPQNRLYIGTGRISGVASKVFIYDASSGGISQIIEALPTNHEVVSLLQVAGRIYVGTRAAAQGTAGEIRIYRTTPSGNNTYTASALTHSSLWDFGYPEEVKLLEDIVVECEPLAAGEAIAVSFENEAGTVISTDVDGTTMSFSTASGTSKTFKVSGLSTAGSAVTRLVKRGRIRLTLTAGTNSATTPTCYAVTIHARSVGYVKAYDLVVSLEDEKPGTRLFGKQISGQAQAANLRALTPANPGSVVVAKFEPKYQVSGSNVVPTAVSAVAVTVEDADIRLSGKSEGVARLTLKEITVTN